MLTKPHIVTGGQPAVNGVKTWVNGWRQGHYQLLKKKALYRYSPSVYFCAFTVDVVGCNVFSYRVIPSLIHLSTWFNWIDCWNTFKNKSMHFEYAGSRLLIHNHRMYWFIDKQLNVLSLYILFVYITYSWGFNFTWEHISSVLTTRVSRELPYNGRKQEPAKKQ